MNPQLVMLLLDLAALAAAAALARGLARLLSSRMADAGLRWGVVSRVNERSSHTRPTSRLGGVGLVGGFMAGAIFLIAALWLMPRGPYAWGGNLPLLAALLGSGSLLFALGLADDLRDLPPVVKLGGQVLALAPLLLVDFRFLDLELPAVAGFGAVAVSRAAALLWLLFFVNAFNFMDGMDGFAAAFARHVCVWLTMIVVLKAFFTVEGPFRLSPNQDYFDFRIELMLLPVLASACAGFYRVNRPPARVFMGDGGSLPLGFWLAAQVVLADGAYYTARARLPQPGDAAPAGAVFLLLLPFIFDVLLTLVRRARRGENLLSAHRSHLYQRLMICGFGHAEVLALNRRYFRATATAALFYAFLPWPSARALIALAALGVMAHYWLRVLKAERAAR